MVATAKGRARVQKIIRRGLYVEVSIHQFKCLVILDSIPHLWQEHIFRGESLKVATAGKRQGARGSRPSSDEEGAPGVLLCATGTNTHSYFPTPSQKTTTHEKRMKAFFGSFRRFDLCSRDDVVLSSPVTDGG